MQAEANLDSANSVSFPSFAAMVKAIAAAAFAALASTAAAARCQNLTIPISVSARNGLFDVTNPTDNIEATNFALRMARQGHNYTMESLNGYHTVSGDYNISATYCEPDAGPGQVLQILTHGIGFDRRYSPCLALSCTC